ncbi:MAG: hypothetical protein LC122_13485 [Chitinophagales bacterium]|nr:hypothetical protein [Chitinophagales bacterium]
MSLIKYIYANFNIKNIDLVQFTDRFIDEIYKDFNSIKCLEAVARYLFDIIEKWDGWTTNNIDFSNYKKDIYDNILSMLTLNSYVKLDELSFIIKRPIYEAITLSSSDMGYFYSLLGNKYQNEIRDSFDLLLKHVNSKRKILSNLPIIANLIPTIEEVLSPFPELYEILRKENNKPIILKISAYDFESKILKFLLPSEQKIFAKYAEALEKYILKFNN